MSCTIEIRQYLPLSQIFQEIYTTVNEIASYFLRDFLHIVQPKTQKLKKDEPFLENNVFLW
jgi:hypothetical protein